MTGIRHKVTALFAICTLLTQGSDVYAYGTRTHAKISFIAYNNAVQTGQPIQANFFQALNIDPLQSFSTPTEGHTGAGWVIAGSIREDTDGLNVSFLTVPRSVMHFDDPVFSRGFSFSPLASNVISVKATPSDQWAIQGTGTVVGCLATIGCLTSDPANDFSYSAARLHFFNGLTKADPLEQNREFAAMFLSLGHVIHLIQDAAQPQHVRNDAHIETDSPVFSFLNNPSVYEHYVDNAYSQLSSTLPPVLPGIVYPVPSFPSQQFFFADHRGRGIAEFTNLNFVSAGTNCTTDAVGSCTPGPEGYPLPTILGTNAELFVDAAFAGDGARCRLAEASLLAEFPALCTTDKINFLTNTVSDFNTSTFFTNKRMSTHSIFDQDLKATKGPEIFALNRLNYDQQAMLLLSRAEAYSEGLLDYFFRGSVGIQGSPSALQITNTTLNGTTPEDMDGTFSLYFDDATGNRLPVPGFTPAQLSIPATTTNKDLKFLPPTSPTPVSYTLVFNGKLGLEDGAIAAKQFHTLTVSKAGSGTGSITSSAVGINCDTSCASQTAAFGADITQITLTASPASNSTFVGWSGACTGSSASLTLNVSANLTCTAVFDSKSVANCGMTFLCTSFDNPNGFTTSTTFVGINNAGNIIGTYGSGPPDFNTHGLLLSGGTSTTIDAPGVLTNATGINNSGEIVGFFFDSDLQHRHGFLRSSNGGYNIIDSPAALLQTYIFAVNDFDTMIGSSDVGGPFLLSTKGFSPIPLPSNVLSASFAGINNSGTIVGNYFDQNFVGHGFVLSSDGTFKNIDSPTFAGPLGINNNGDIVGQYFDQTTNTYHGFLLKQDTITTIDFPGKGKVVTSANGINDLGVIVGNYSDATGFHGFIASPVQ